jgi:hypothetical protein
MSETGIGACAIVACVAVVLEVFVGVFETSSVIVLFSDPGVDVPAEKLPAKRE